MPGGSWLEAFRADVLQGLARAQKAISPRWLYDDAGSALFEEITRTPEYYPTRVETELLRNHAGDIAAAIGPGRAVVEFGAGTAEKTPLLLQAITPSAYYGIDIAGDVVRASVARISTLFPRMRTQAIEADFTGEQELPPFPPCALGFFPGSTIGNFAPIEAAELMARMRAILGPRALLLIGIDCTADVLRLLPAYDDAGGVTARFNLNLLQRINRELAGTVPIDAFAHAVRWDADAAKIEMHLLATRPVAFTMSGQRFDIEQGETIHTEDSHKYSSTRVKALLARGGWDPLKSWGDMDNSFSVILAEAS